MSEQGIVGNDAAIVTRQGITVHYRELPAMLRSRYGRMAEGGERMLCALLADNSLESILLYLMCMRYDIPLVLLDAKIKTEQWEPFIREYCPRYLWLPQQRSGISEDRVVWEALGYRMVYEGEGYQWWLQENVSYAVAEELALLLSTSGSTGSQKFVCLSKANLRDNAEHICQALGIAAGDRAAVMLPISYSYGLSVINTYLLRRGTLLIPEAMLVEGEFWDFLLQAGVNAICGVPYTYEMMYRLKVFERDLSSVRLMTQAGGKLRKKMQAYLARFAQQNGMDFAVMYGQTEATARMSCFFLNRQMDKLGSVGTAIPGGTFYIGGEGKRPIREEGEILYSGGNIFHGYAEGREDLAVCACRTILRTGDMGYLDEEGFLYLTGRKKRFIKLRGYRINLEELQEGLSDQTNTQVVCVKAGQEEKISIFLCRPEERIYELASKLCNQPINRRNAEVFVIEEIPKRGNGKIDYHLLEQWRREDGGDN